MKKIKTIIKDLYTLVLQEPAEKGDYIDLKDLMEVDRTTIEEAIKLKKDEVYCDLVNSVLREYKLAYDKEILETKNKTDAVEQELRNRIKQLEENQELVIKNNKSEVEKKYMETINELNSRIQSIENLHSKQILELESNNKNKEQELRHQIDLKDEQIASLKATSEDKERIKVNELKEQLKDEYEAKINDLKTNLEKEKDINQSNLKLAVLEKEKELKEVYEQRIEECRKELELEKQISNNLRQQKSQMNIKQIGNNLEDWCDERIRELMQNGLFNCKWYADHELVEGEDKDKTKADFIFKVFASEECKDEQEIASICFDMKDEDPNSKNKKNNEHYYKTLDKNRNKKKCKYAVLVSNLELDRQDPLPIFKVREYEDMYVVRPGYLTSFINMVVSLSTRYQEMILNHDKEMLELSKQEQIIEEFNKIKQTYLDKPLEGLAKQVNNISEQTASIKKANEKIKDACDKIIDDYIDSIIKKLNTFEIKVKKLN